MKITHPQINNIISNINKVELGISSFLALGLTGIGGYPTDN